jgi:hypothetical protein
VHNPWYKLRPDKFPRHQWFAVWWWFKSLYDIDFIYFKIHGHWPTDRSGMVISLKKKDFCNKDLVDSQPLI